MGRYLDLIKDMDVSSPIGQNVLKRLATFRAMGISRVDPEEVARAAVADFDRELADLRKRYSKSTTSPLESAASTSTAQPVSAPAPADAGKAARSAALLEQMNYLDHPPSTKIKFCS